VAKWQSTVVAGVRGNEGKVGETVLCSTRCGDKAGSTWGGGHQRRAVTTMSPLAVSRTRMGDWRKPFKRQLRLTSGHWLLFDFSRFLNTQTLKSEMVTFLVSKFLQLLHVCKETLLSMLPFATLVSESKPSVNDQLDYCSRCKSPSGSRKRLSWILSWVCQELSQAMIPFG
jgi:hypothetical protein